MKKLLIILLLLCTPAFAQTYTVERVIDGDTIKLTNGEEVSLIGIDAPEKTSGIPLGGDFKKYDEYDGNKATEFVKMLFSSNKKVRLEYDIEERDKCGRLLAYVFIKWSAVEESLPPIDNKIWFKDKEGVAECFVNAFVVQQGYASPLAIPPNVKYADVLKELYEEARREGRGFWKFKKEGDVCESDFDCTYAICSDEKKEMFAACRSRWTVTECLERKCNCAITCDEWMEKSKKAEADACADESECRSIDCSKHDMPMKEGYKPYCVEAKCQCMCYGCE